MRRGCLDIQPAFWIPAVIALVVFPTRWVVAWVAAVVFHELGHYLTLILFRVSVHSVSIKLTGAYMYTAPMSVGQESVVAAAGPVFSLILIFFARWIPSTAFCAFFQLVFNVLPFPGFDGGRILGNCLQVFLPERKVKVVMWSLQVVVLAVIGIVAVTLRWSILVLMTAVILFVRIGRVTFPCKHRKQIVQWCK